MISAVCGDQTVNFVVNGNGIFSPAHDTASTSVLIPTALDVTLKFTPASGGPPSVDHAIVGKSAPIKDTIDCTVPLQTLLSGPAGRQTIEGIIGGFLTPR